MRITQFLPFVAAASAFVITDEGIFQSLEKSGQRTLDSAREVFEEGKNALDDGFAKAADSVKKFGDDVFEKIYNAGCDVESWMEGSPFADQTFDDFEDSDEHPHPPQERRPRNGRPKHPPHHGKPNLTIYQMIAKSKYTTKLAELINEYDDLVEALNSTAANYTVFAPTDSAFEKIPDHGKKPSKEFLKNLLLYHVSSDFYPAARVLHSYTIPTLYEPETLGHNARLTVRVTLKGPAINFYSRIVAVNIFATNGVIHGVDSILMPPPSVSTIISLLPGTFSTLSLALEKTGITDSDKYNHVGGTLFAPSNTAFQKLGPKINAFLFSKYGQKYLSAILHYHMVANQTLYTDAFFDSDDKDVEAHQLPYAHYDLPSILGPPLAVDEARYGPFIAMRVNAFSRVTVHDGAGSDGVIQVLSNVLIPPKRSMGQDVHWQGEELSVDEFKERFEPYLGEGENMEL